MRMRRLCATALLIGGVQIIGTLIERLSGASMTAEIYYATGILVGARHIADGRTA